MLTMLQVKFIWPLNLFLLLVQQRNQKKKIFSRSNDNELFGSAIGSIQTLNYTFNDLVGFMQNVDLNMNHKLTEALNLGASYFFTTGKYDVINKTPKMASGQLPGRLLPVQAHRRRHHTELPEGGRRCDLRPRVRLRRLRRQERKAS